MDYEVGIVSDIYFDEDVIRNQRVKVACVLTDKIPVEIRVQKVTTPGDFCFHLAEMYPHFLKMEHEMNEYYRQNYSTEEAALPEGKAEPFEVYAWYSRPKRSWVRVFKDAYHDYKNGFEVVLMDYAEKEFVPNEQDLRYLMPEFCILEAQGYVGKLKVDFVQRHRIWTEGESSSFRNEVLHKLSTVKPSIFLLGSNQDHPYVPVYTTNFRKEGPVEAYYGRKYKIDPLPKQKAHIDVTRVNAIMWSRRCM